MSRWVRMWLARGAAVVMLVCVVSGWAVAAGGEHYLITNDDVVPFLPTGATFYTVGTGGALTLKEQVVTGGDGIAGGYFGAKRIAVLNNGSQQCVYASEAMTGDIVGIVVSTLVVGGSAFGSDTDSGAANGIGLAVNAQYLYASFTSSNTIGTFQVQAGCGLTFVNDVTVVGLQGGFIDGMAIHGNIMVVSYGDGSIESFDISAGTPVSNGDEQNSTGFTKLGSSTYPNGIDITQDGHYAVFGDSSNSTVVEVSDISSGKLSATVVYSLGTTLSSSNIMLSPDETLVYISNTQGDRISAALFDKASGKVSPGCASGTLRGYVKNWSYLAGLATETNTGTGGVVYVAEFGAPQSSIGMIRVSSSGGKCTLAEVAGSPVFDANSAGLLSIGTFPPRAF
jgi:6-phosphogluconolactonase (cycloisomerase 2 family)